MKGLPFNTVIKRRGRHVEVLEVNSESNCVSEYFTVRGSPIKEMQSLNPVQNFMSDEGL